MVEFMQKIAEVLRLSRLERRWQKLARALAIVVVFCTTYMLILPAITMESRTSCGMSEHTHKFSCYLDDEVLICGIPEHKHSDACFIEKATDGNVTDGNVTDGNVADEDIEEDMGFFDRIMLFGTPRSDILYYSELENFLVSATIKDYDGQPIESGGTVYVGQHYTVDLEFSEVNSGGTWSQFAYDENGYLTYSLPSNLNFDHFGVTEWRDINFTDPNTGTVRKVGTYHIYDDGTLKVRFDTESNGVNFIDNYTNVDFHVNFSATVGNSQSGNKTEINFGNDIMVDLNVDGSAAMNVTKSHGSYDGKNNTLDYQIRIEATKAVIKDLVVPDDVYLENKHHILKDTIVVTDLKGNVLDPQPTIGPGRYPATAETGFTLTGFPDFAAGEGFLINYKAAINDDQLGQDSVGLWNGVYPYGKDALGGDVKGEATDWATVELNKIVKGGKQAVLYDAYGNPVPVIEWEVEIRKSDINLQGTVLIDTLGEGLEYYTGKDIVIKRYDQWGYPLNDSTLSWNNVEINNNSMSFPLPDGYRYVVVYYTTYEDIQDGEQKHYTNTAKVTINHKEEIAGGEADVVGFIPHITKSASGDDGKYAYFTIEADVPGVIKNWGSFFLTDLAAIWSYKENDVGYLYVENAPEDLVITAVTKSGQTINFTPYVEGGPVENTYILVTPAQGNQEHSFNILFNTSVADKELSTWTLAEDSKLTVSYKIPFDAKTGIEWTGELTGDLTLEDVLLKQYKMANEAYLNYTDVIQAVATSTYSYMPKITKKSITNEDGTIDYTVTFYNSIPGSTGPLGYLESSNSVVFTDTFDEKLEYVPGSLSVMCYSPWSDGTWFNKYVYNGTAQGNSLNVNSTDLVYNATNQNLDADMLSWLRDWMPNYQVYCNGIAGGRHVFTYKLRVKDIYRNTTEENKYLLDNTAELFWDGDNSSGPVTDTAEFKTGLLDKHYAQDGSKLDFDIHINRNALDILLGAPTLTIVDTMTHNLSIYWQSIKLLYEDPYGNWIDFDSQESIYDYEVTYDAVANALTFIVPDSLHIRIDYSTLITESGMVSVNNSVKIDGKAEVTDVVDAEFRVTDHDGGASGSVGSLTLLKHSGITGENLPNAVLALYGPVRPDGITAPEGTPATVEGHGNTLYYIATYTTGPDGTALMENQYLVHGNMYALYEVTPPAGYIKPDEPTFFYFYDKGDDETVQTVSTIITVPNYIEGDYLLPETGGMGTHILYITGGLLMFLSVVFLLGKHKSTRKRRSDFSRA